MPKKLLQAQSSARPKNTLVSGTLIQFDNESEPTAVEGEEGPEVDEDLTLADPDTRDLRLPGDDLHIGLLLHGERVTATFLVLGEEDEAMVEVEAGP